MSAALAVAQKIDTARRYTYADYATWADYPRFELIEGEAFEMPAPLRVHQKILVELTYQFHGLVRGTTSEVLCSPFDVRINYKTLDNTVVQPDILVVCDPAQLENGKHCLGAPDLAVEILSESSLRHDKIRKLNIYKDAGVREYWIVDPTAQIVDVYILKDGEYFINSYGKEDKVPVHVLENCEIELNEVFK
jgi:Uma2 family endonuclease